ncbi:uncharacterized protein LOC132269824 [Cornus florida]|uniref:uncharacterized protein LOC132269824 n=1 Tax=Cornus florida TaxID=4283 RepID=UPI00289CB3AD|nr:uncharacterized protein LOC132269824 [Cornus florida]
MDPLALEVWLDLMVRKLDSMAVPTDRLKISLTASIFMGDADIWWRSMTNIHDMEVMTWEEFRTLFFERFFHRAMRWEMRIQFTDETRAMKFHNGLHLDIRPRVSVLDLRTYRKVVLRTMLAEVEEQDQLRIRGSHKQPRSDAPSSSGNQWKKAKAGNTTHSQGAPQQNRSASTVPASKPTASTKGFQGTYNYYKQPGHMRKDCPHLRSRARSGTEALCLLLQDISRVTRVVLNSQGLRDELMHCHRPILPLGLLQFEVMQRDSFLCVDTPVGSPVSLDCVCQGYVIEMAGQILEFDFIVYNMTGFDVTLGMDWLSFFHATIDCFGGRVSIYTPIGDCFHFMGDQRDSHSTMTFSIGDWSRYRSYLASLLADEDNYLGCIYPAVVVKFLDGFPEELIELPPLREVVFAIDVIPGTAPISMVLSQINGQNRDFMLIAKPTESLPVVQSKLRVTLVKFEAIEAFYSVQ